MWLVLPYWKAQVCRDSFHILFCSQPSLLILSPHFSTRISFLKAANGYPLSSLVIIVLSFFILLLNCYWLSWSDLHFLFLAVQHVGFNSLTSTWTRVPALGAWSLNHWAAREVLTRPSLWHVLCWGSVTLLSSSVCTIVLLHPCGWPLPLLQLEVSDCPRYLSCTLHHLSTSLQVLSTSYLALDTVYVLIRTNSVSPACLPHWALNTHIQLPTSHIHGDFW